MAQTAFLYQILPKLFSLGFGLYIYNMVGRRRKYVTAPAHAILGSQMVRNRIVKEMFIQQLGGSCADCGLVYKKNIISRKYQSRVSKKVQRSNLEAHYVGNDREDHIGYELGKLRVPMQNKLSVQKKYFKTFIKYLCPCKLLCRRCHGKFHGKESGS